jgi:hypothetical protein
MICKGTYLGRLVFRRGNERQTIGCELNVGYLAIEFVDLHVLELISRLEMALAFHAPQSHPKKNIP